MTLRRTLLPALLAIAFALTAPSRALAAPPAITSHQATIDGLSIHYLQTGHGPAILLLHGFAETSRMWRPVMEQLGDRFTLIAPDLPGYGGSAIPATPPQFHTAAVTMNKLVHSLGIQHARVVGHDIGLMAAYAYAAQFPAETDKLVLMDAFLPGIGNWRSIYDSPNLWHFRFHGPTPEALIRGREDVYFAYFWNDLAADGRHSIPPADRAAYLADYSRPGRMHAAWQYFAAFPQTALDFANDVRKPLPMPILVISGEKSGCRHNVISTEAGQSHRPAQWRTCPERSRMGPRIVVEQSGCPILTTVSSSLGWARTMPIRLCFSCRILSAISQAL